MPSFLLHTRFIQFKKKRNGAKIIRRGQCFCLLLTQLYISPVSIHSQHPRFKQKMEREKKEQQVPRNEIPRHAKKGPLSSKSTALFFSCAGVKLLSAAVSWWPPNKNRHLVPHCEAFRILTHTHTPAHCMGPDRGVRQHASERSCSAMLITTETVVRGISVARF